MRWQVATLCGSLLLSGGCRTGGRNTEADLVRATGHLVFVSKAAGMASNYGPVTNAAALCDRHVIVVTDKGMRVLLRIDGVEP